MDLLLPQRLSLINRYYRCGRLRAGVTATNAPNIGAHPGAKFCFKSICVCNCSTMIRLGARRLPGSIPSSRVSPLVNERALQLRQLSSTARLLNGFPVKKSPSRLLKIWKNTKRLGLLSVLVTVGLLGYHVYQD